MPRLFVSFSLLLGFLFTSCATLADEPTPEVRAVWVASLAPGIRAPEEIPLTVDALRRANLNTLIAQIRRQGMVYFQSDLEPRATSIEGPADWDPLAQIVEEAHDTSGGGQRLDVHAWFNVYALGSQQHLAGATPTPIAEAHPEWYTRSPSGEVLTFLDPGVPEVTEHFAALVAECLDRYEVDGVNLDFVRYTEDEGGAGYNPIALERFHRLTGRTDIPANRDPEWSAFRRDQVTALVRRTMVTILEHRPEAMLSVCAVGFGGPPRPGQTFEDTSPYIQVHQDWVGWARAGIADVVTRMGYKREHVPQQAADYRGWGDLSRALQDESGRIITMGIGGYFNEPEGVLNQYREAQARGLGTTLFSYHRPQGDAEETGLLGPRSPFWDTLGREIYTEPVPPPDPTWREGLGTIAGFLRDENGDPLDTVEVSLMDTDHVTRSDGSGFFAFLNLEPGECVILAPGSTVDGESATVSANEVTWVNR
ncbi:family 10 glycosylhydrolase [Candidatus Sumerlaeota bacterium]|nr:family 10 glycosylhydrolase [Candidatus Sumerlaeota bacterium]